MTGPSKSRESDELTQVARTFEDISKALANIRDPNHALAALTHLAAQRVDGAEHAGITIGRAGTRFRTIAATSDLVRDVDRIQYEAGSGPCVDAVVESAFLRSNDLTTDARWPVFGPRASRLGIFSMLSHRLYLETEQGAIAALNWYSTARGAFGEADDLVALVLATYGASELARVGAQNKADNLRVALQSSREIGMAMGILMDQHKITRDQAFDVLRTASQHSQRKLAEIANDVADTGTLPDLSPQRTSTGPAV